MYNKETETESIGVVFTKRRNFGPLALCAGITNQYPLLSLDFKGVSPVPKFSEHLIKVT